MNPVSAETRLLWQRSHEYARCAYALSQDPRAVGTEALFDNALNNGLAVIVSTAWPGDEFDQPPRRRRHDPSQQPEHWVKPASRLLDLLMEKATHPSSSITPAGADLADDQVRVLHIEKTPEPEVVTLTVTTLREGEPPFRPLFPLGDNPDDDIDTGEDIVRIEIATLREAITIAHPVRHGRPRPGDPEQPHELHQRHIDALLALDRHPRLQGLTDEQVDADYIRDKARDLWLRDNAWDYLQLLNDDEIQRRVEAADDYGPNPGDGGWPLQDCPVCDNETLVPTTIDDFGIGIAVGTCIVCGYWRSPRIVDELAIDARWEHVNQYD